MDEPRLIEIDDRPAIEFTLEFADASAETVWELAATPAGLERWFPSRVDLQPVPGGTIWFSGDEHTDDSPGVVTAFHLGRLLGFTWGDNSIRLEVDGEDDVTLFRLTDILSDRNEAARNAAGWIVHLAKFRHALDDSFAVPAWRDEYDRLVGADWPHGAPLPESASGARGAASATTADSSVGTERSPS